MESFLQINVPHPWVVSPREAIAIQEELKGLIVERPFGFSALKTVAGVDVSYSRKAASVHAAIAVLSFPDLQVLEERVASVAPSFPYVPGLLAFREGPAVVKALCALEMGPDAFVFDGQGIAHPRGFGIASHFGVLLRRPTVGCAKSRLFGEAEGPGSRKGSSAPLRDGDRVVGAVLRTRDSVAPVFVSVGNAIDLEAAVWLVLQCTTRYRLPEPLRRAHFLAGRARQREESGVHY